MTGPYEVFTTSVARHNGTAVKSPKPPTFHASLCADEGSVASLGRLLRAWLELCRADDWRRDDVVRAVAEACGNVVYQAHPGTRSGRMDVSADVDEHELHVTVTDTGVGIRQRATGDGPPFGLGTVSALSTAVVINATNDGSATLLTFTPAAAPADRGA
jgi:anti-sigma regulatory factor (Ser/Thr protein kinase)